jgi:hypothetical protein
MFIALFVIPIGMLRLIVTIIFAGLAVLLIMIIFTVVVTPRLCHTKRAQ